MPTAFVTGSTGLLGSNLTRLLLANGYAVRGLARDPSKAERTFADLALEKSERLTVVAGDMLDVPAWADALEGADTLFHTAAYFRESFRMGEHRERLWTVNVEGTRALLEAADRAGLARAVHTSSSGVLPHTDARAVLDETAETPAGYRWPNPYFESKHAADRAVRDFLASHRMPVAFVLPGWMFGPGDDGPTSAGRLVLDFLEQKLPGAPNASLAVADARDVALTLFRAAEVLEADPEQWRGERFIAGGPYTSFRTLADTLEAETGVAAPKRTLPIWLMRLVAVFEETKGRLRDTDPLLTRRSVRTLAAGAPLDNSKAEEILGVRFRPLAQTLRDTVAYYRERSTFMNEKAASR